MDDTTPSLAEGTPGPAEMVPTSEAAPDLMAQLLDIAGAGGPVLLILLGLSLVGVTLVLIKAGQMIRLRLWDRRPLRAALAAWKAGRRHEAVAALDGVPHPVAGPLAYAMAETARGEMTEAAIREEAERRGEAVLEDLRGQQRPLEIIAGISPLLGLLGTVLGMIEAFRQLERAGAAADPAILSGGIWEALLTTAAGLAIAVPAVIAVQVLDRLVDRVRHELGDAVTRVFTQTGHRAGPASAATEPAREVGRAA